MKPNTLCMIKIAKGKPFSDLSGQIVVTRSNLVLEGRTFWKVSPELITKDSKEPVNYAIESVLYPLDNSSDDLVDEISKVKEMI